MKSYLLALGVFAGGLMVMPATASPQGWGEVDGQKIEIDVKSASLKDILESIDLEKIEDAIESKMSLDEDGKNKLRKIFKEAIKSASKSSSPTKTMKTIERAREQLKEHFGEDSAKAIRTEIVSELEGLAGDDDQTVKLEINIDGEESEVRIDEEKIEALGRAAEKWAERFAERMEGQAEQLEVHLENFGERVGQRIEKWAEQFSEGWEEWAESHEGEWENWSNEYSDRWEQWASRMKGAGENEIELDEDELEEVIRGNLEMLSKMPLRELYDQIVRSGKKVKDIPWEDVEDLENTIGDTIDHALGAIRDLAEDDDFVVKHRDIAEGLKSKLAEMKAQATGEVEGAQNDLARKLDEAREMMTRIAEQNTRRAQEMQREAEKKLQKARKEMAREMELRQKAMQARQREMESLQRKMAAANERGEVKRKARGELSDVAREMIAQIERMDKAGQTDKLREMLDVDVETEVEVQVTKSDATATNSVLEELMKAVKSLQADVNELKDQVNDK